MIDDPSGNEAGRASVRILAGLQGRRGRRGLGRRGFGKRRTQEVGQDRSLEPPRRRPGRRERTRHVRVHPQRVRGQARRGRGDARRHVGGELEPLVDLEQR